MLLPEASTKRFTTHREIYLTYKSYKIHNLFSYACYTIIRVYANKSTWITQKIPQKQYKDTTVVIIGFVAVLYVYFDLPVKSSVLFFAVLIV